MNPRSIVARLVLPALTACLVAGCEDSTVTGPTTPPGGSIRVATATTGDALDLDPDGYAISVDEGEPRSIGINSTWMFTDLEPGERDVELTGIARNCEVTSGNPQRVAVVGGQTATARFHVECTERAELAPGTIAFARLREDDWWLTGDIWVVGADAASPVRLTTDAYAPAWSPDGSRIAFSSYGDEDTTDVWVMEADGSELVRLTHDPAFDGYPAWSPDGSRIAFSSNRDGIWVMEADGSELVRLTSDGDSPAWSPDGSKIAFHSDRAGIREVWVMEADGSEPVRLTRDGGWSPAWSPDGSKIAFSTGGAGNYDIWVMDANGSDPRRLTTHGGGSPAWSPDGSRIAFHSDRAGNYDIWVMDADGSDPRRLTDDPNDELWPAWSSKEVGESP